VADDWTTEPLTLEHQLGHLNSGRPEIDSWLTDHAVRLQRDCACFTHVWCDNQHPYVYGFYTLMPYRLKSADSAGVSGYTGGELSGYLIAKIGVNKGAECESRELTSSDDETMVIPVPALLLMDALIDMEHAAGTAGGKWAFIDITGEPQCILDELDLIGFQPINQEGSPIHFLRLIASHSSIRPLPS
jgi:hypothetical protein